MTFAKPSDQRHDQLLPFADNRLLDIGNNLLCNCLDVRHGYLVCWDEMSRLSDSWTERKLRIVRNRMLTEIC